MAATRATNEEPVRRLARLDANMAASRAVRDAKNPAACIDIDDSVVVVIQSILFVPKWIRSCGSDEREDALEPEAGRR